MKASCPAPDSALRDRASEQGAEYRRPERPPAIPPASQRRARDALGRREHDADDQPGFEHFAEDDEQAGEHGLSPSLVSTAISVPVALVGVIVVEEA